MAENSSWPCLQNSQDMNDYFFHPPSSPLSLPFQKPETIMYLCDKYATLIESGLNGVLIKGLSVEFVTWTSLYWVCQVSYYHVIALLSNF